MSVLCWGNISVIRVKTVVNTAAHPADCTVLRVNPVRVYANVSVCGMSSIQPNAAVIVPLRNIPLFSSLLTPMCTAWQVKNMCIYIIKITDTDWLIKIKIPSPFWCHCNAATFSKILRKPISNMAIFFNSMPWFIDAHKFFFYRQEYSFLYNKCSALAYKGIQESLRILNEWMNLLLSLEREIFHFAKLLSEEKSKK